MSKVVKLEGTLGGKKIVFEKGHLAGQANAAVRVQYGDTVVLAAVTSGAETRPGVNYMPLVVDYEEKMYASGKIKGSRFIKREGRPTDEAILVSRLVDRTLRPLFDPKIRNDIQVIATVLSLDPEADPHVTALIAASVALSVSGIPTLYGPIGACRIAEAEGEAALYPSADVLASSHVDLLVAGTRDKVNMIEASGLDIPEEKMAEYINRSHQEIQTCVSMIEKFKDQCGEIKPVEMIYAPAEVSPELKDKIKVFLEDKLDAVLFAGEKSGRNTALGDLLASLLVFLGELDADGEAMVKTYFEELISARARAAILEKDKRTDGRGLSELRKISCGVGVLPRTHGTALFERGLTQALSVVTLGAPGDEQVLDSMDEDGVKRYFHHYNFPPYSVGEVAMLRGPGRREIGHGALAEKAIIPYLPKKEDFPYTIRVVTEVLSSNGSTSMAATCGSSLALMDAGVPLSKAVAGISMGIFFAPDQKSYKLATDIQGIEDHDGDMDFKVAGTCDGISAIQLDVKNEGLPLSLFPEILKRSRAARLEILAKMNRALASPRPDLSPYAPRIVTIAINPDKIRDVIGPGGKVINAIIKETGVDIDIEDSGLVMVTSADAEASRKAVEWINNLTREVKAGEEFQGKITRLMDFGAFAEVLPGQEGLIHVSEIAPFRVERVDQYLKVGQIVPVRVLEIDDRGRINLTCKNLLKIENKEGEEGKDKPQSRFSGRFPGFRKSR
ncbi:MAG: polyribonucleotide nucleotidyltransferase [bacterium]|nr:polyribonucleotide nucleotidyltransferase [bacterium]